MTDDRARNRFFTIQALRLGGAAITVIGLAGMTDKIALAHAPAAALLVIGLVDFLVMPLVLARRWRSPRP